MRQPTLFLTVGLPCTGKTTAARRIEVEQKALRLTKDEWVKALYGYENPPSAQDVIEGRLIHAQASPELTTLDSEVTGELETLRWRRRESNPRPPSHRLNVYKLRLPLDFARRQVGSRPTAGLAIL